MSTKKSTAKTTEGGVHSPQVGVGVDAADAKAQRREARKGYGILFGHRCKIARGSLDIGDAAAQIGVHRNTIWNIERGESLPDAYELQLMAATYGVSVSELLGLKSTLTMEDEDLAWVDMLDVHVSAGSGSHNGSADVAGRFAFKRSWLERKGVSPEKAKIVRARGDSMADRINDGDILLVNTAVQQLGQDGVYVIELDGLDYVKLLQRDFATGGVQILSYNPDYRPQMLSAEQASDLRITGRVVWHGGEL